MAGCRELRRLRRELRLQRMLPGIASMGALYGVPVPLAAPAYDLSQEWYDFQAAQAARAAQAVHASQPAPPKPQVA